MFEYLDSIYSNLQINNNILNIILLFRYQLIIVKELFRYMIAKENIILNK